MRGGNKAVIIPHRHEGVFIAKSKDDALVTKSMVPGDSVYNEKRISVQVIFSCFFFSSQSPFHLIETDFFHNLTILVCSWMAFVFMYFLLGFFQNEDGAKVEYRVWNPFRSKLGAAIQEGIDNIWIVSDCYLALCNWCFYYIDENLVSVSLLLICSPYCHFQGTRCSSSLLGSCFRNLCLSCIWHCWTCKLVEYICSLPPSSPG